MKKISRLVITFILILLPTQQVNAIAPLILVGKGIALLFGAAKVTAVALSIATFKTAAVGTAFFIKVAGTAIAVKKLAATAAIIGGFATIPVGVEATLNVLKEFEYKVENTTTGEQVRREIEIKITKGIPYTTPYCINPAGDKIIVSEEHKFCPYDGKPPRKGYEVQYDKTELN